jgi:tetratricopeptide (TPR) repeat protein
MIVALALLLLSAEDPRIPVAELQLERRHSEALARVEVELAEDPETAAGLGFHYLRGHLLEELGRQGEAQRAFRDAARALPQLSSYSRYRLARSQFHRGHPEVSAGLLAMLLGDQTPQPLLGPAADLLIRSIDEGGDCSLLGSMNTWSMDGKTRRGVELARADCLLRQGQREGAQSALVELLQQDVGDDPARAAAERLSQLLPPTGVEVATSRVVGMAFYSHRQFSLSIRFLTRGLGAPASWQTELTEEDDFETLYALARSNFWSRNYIQAASQFGQLAAAVSDPEEKARALYQQGRCYELSGNWDYGARSYRLAYLADKTGPWADAGLMSAMRIEWRTGKETTALELYELLSQRRSWQQMLNRASLFLASSDLVRGRTDRARRWLERTVRLRDHSPVEVEYWWGRLYESSDPEQAVSHYIDALLEDAYHPLAQGARRRMAEPPLQAAALARAKRLASSNRSRDLYAAWLLLGDGNEEGRRAHQRLLERLGRDSRARPYLEMEARPPATWPIWDARLTQPEETLLALGVWDQGSSVVLKHFPVTDASLAYTGGQILAQAAETRPSIYVAEILRKRMPDDLPWRLTPNRLERLLYPLPFRDLIERESRLRGIDPLLLAALMREESRFDPNALSSASARGLAQFVLPTAHRLAQQIGIENFEPRDLYSPDVSIALGAAYLAELAAAFGNQGHMVLAAYNAGEDQTVVWRSYCYSREPEEFFSKVGFSQTRNYLRKVLSSRAHYAELYERDAP